MLWVFKINFVDFVGFLSVVIQVMLFYICSARLGNLPGCVTGFRLCNRLSGYATGRPDRVPESPPIRLLNRVAKPTQLYNRVGLAISG